MRKIFKACIKGGVNTSIGEVKIIQNGENSYIEFKEEGIRAKELAEEIVSFSNSEVA